MKAQWQKERTEVSELSELKAQIEQKRIEMEQAEKRGDLEKAAQLKYGDLLELQKKLDHAYVVEQDEDTANFYGALLLLLRELRDT